jgi:hypothetical protein
MKLWAPFFNGLAGLCSLYSLTSAPQPKPAVMVMLICSCAANAGALYLWLLYLQIRKTRIF